MLLLVFATIWNLYMYILLLFFLFSSCTHHVSDTSRVAMVEEIVQMHDEEVAAIGFYEFLPGESGPGPEIGGFWTRQAARGD